MPLGVNENKVDHMCLILDQLHKYVPTIVTTQKTLLPDGDVYEDDQENLYVILAGGDQLTMTRSCSTIGI